jgi:epoxide hydrolase 4
LTPLFAVPELVSDPEFGRHVFVTSTHDVKLHVVDIGPLDAPIVLLLHGFPDCWVGWKSVMTRLVSLGFRAVAMDLRGFGLSDAPSSGALPGFLDATRFYHNGAALDDVVAVLDWAERTASKRPPIKPIIMAHDLGGQPAWLLAASLPGRVASVVIAASPHPALAAANLTVSQLCRSYYMSLFNLPGLPEAACWADGCKAIASCFMENRHPADLPPRLANSLDPTMGESTDPVAIAALQDPGSQLVAAVDAETVASVRHLFSRPGRITAALNWYRCLFAPSTLHFSKALALPEDGGTRIEVPLLQLAPEGDVALGPELASGTRMVASRGASAIVPRASHWVHSERPGSLVATMLVLLDSAGETERLPPKAKEALASCLAGDATTPGAAALMGDSPSFAGKLEFVDTGLRVFAPKTCVQMECWQDIVALAWAAKSALVSASA